LSLKKRPRSSNPPDSFLSPDSAGLLVLFLLVFAVYLRTLCPCFLDDDSPETITAGVTLGLQHPPGYPCDALLNRLAGLVPLGGAGFRANTASALLAAFGVLLLAFNLRLVLTRALLLKIPAKISPWVIRACVYCAALTLAFSRTYWQKAISAKGGIYLLETDLLLAFFFCFLSLETDGPKRGSAARWPVLLFFLLGLGFSHYWESQLVFIPAFFLFFILDPRLSFSPGAWPKKIFKSLTWVLLGASVLGLYLPLRSRLEPVLNLGDPENWNYFKLDVTRAYFQNREPSFLAALWHGLTGSASWDSVNRMWFSMTQDQNLEIPIHLWVDIRFGSAALALVGLFTWWRAKGQRSLLFLLIASACLLAAFYTTWVIPEANSRWEVDNYLLPWNWIAALLAGVGLWKLSPFRAQPRAGLARPAWLKALWILLLAALPLEQFCSNAALNDQQFQMLRYDYGENLLKSTPRGALLFAEGDEDFFPLYYLQNVEHQRPDVCVIPPFTLFETWGVAELEHFHPELGLTASHTAFPDHFARVEYALSEIVAKNRAQRTCAFSYLPGAFHRFYCLPRPQLRAENSGNLLWLYPPARNQKPLALAELCTRHWDDCPSNAHLSLIRIAWIYQQIGLLPRNPFIPN
jgi:hypothetical protein